MDKYRKCCEEVVDKVNDGSNSVEAIKTFVLAQIGGYGLDKNKYIPALISCLENSMGLWDRGRVDVFDLIGELSKLVDDTPAQQQPNPEDVFRQCLSPYIDEANLKLLLSQLPTIKCYELHRYWYERYFQKNMTGRKFFSLCVTVVPHRKGERGWNYNNFKNF